MTAPGNYFGGNSDGAARMESWLTEMCKGCRKGRVEDYGGDEPMRGIGCELPLHAYDDPYDDILEWSADASPPGPMGLRCMAKVERSTKRGPRKPPEGQTVLPLVEVDP